MGLISFNLNELGLTGRWRNSGFRATQGITKLRQSRHVRKPVLINNGRNTVVSPGLLQFPGLLHFFRIFFCIFPLLHFFRKIFYGRFSRASYHEHMSNGIFSMLMKVHFFQNPTDIPTGNTKRTSRSRRSDSKGCSDQIFLESCWFSGRCKL